MTPTQVLEALDEANRIRLYRAEVKRSIKGAGYDDGRHRVADILEAPADELKSMLVLNLLRACHRMGHQLALRHLRRVQIGSGLRVGSLSERQRGALSLLLREGL